MKHKVGKEYKIFCLRYGTIFLSEKCVNTLEEKMNRNNTCVCLQPCTSVSVSCLVNILVEYIFFSEPVYQTSYSAASWPADNYKNTKEEYCKIAQRNNQSCIDYYRYRNYIEL